MWSKANYLFINVELKTSDFEIFMSFLNDMDFIKF